MALVRVIGGISIDTDDLDQAEYHYYRKAEGQKRWGLADAILKGRVTAKDIETNEKYADFRD